MANEHVPEAPTNVTALATGPTSMTVTWDAPWYTGSSPLRGYDVVATDASGRTAEHAADAATASMRVSSLTLNEAYRFKVAARNASGASPFSDQSDEVVMVFSTVSLAKEEFGKAKGRLSMFRRTTLTARRPIGLAARDSQNEYRGATQRADDDFEPLRRYSADEDSGWVPPTSKE